MPKNLSLFGKYLQDVGKAIRKGWKRTQLTKPMPPKAMGLMPSAASQMSLWGADDFKKYTRKQPKCGWTKRFIKPANFRKDFESEALNATIYNLRVSSNALYSIDDAGGFDNYILRSPPQELRSNTGEKMRNLMYYYMKNPDIYQWGLPWKVLMRKRAQQDPHYYRYVHEARKAYATKKMEMQHSKYSPYYLPTEAAMHPARQEFMEGSLETKLDLWWKSSPQLEAAFRRRLGEAKSFERAHPDHRELHGFKVGEGMGGGGPSGTAVRKRGKTHKYRAIRPY